MWMPYPLRLPSQLRTARRLFSHQTALAFMQWFLGCWADNSLLSQPQILLSLPLLPSPSFFYFKSLLSSPPPRMEELLSPVPRLDRMCETEFLWSYEVFWHRHFQNRNTPSFSYFFLSRRWTYRVRRIRIKSELRNEIGVFPVLKGLD